MWMDGWKERERGEGRNEVQRSPDFECRVISNAQRQRHDTAKRDVNGLVQASMTIILYPGRVSTGCLYLERTDYERTPRKKETAGREIEGSPQGGVGDRGRVHASGSGEHADTSESLQVCDPAIQRSSDPAIQ